MASRGATGPAPKSPEVVGLPFRAFFYTLDQITVMIQVEINQLKIHYIHFEGRSPGACPKDKMKTLNVAPHDQKPEWRVSEQELIRWMRVKGIKYYERGWGR